MPMTSTIAMAKGPVQNIQLDVHTMEPAIIVRYDVSNPRGTATKKEGNNKQQKQTIVHLKALNEEMDPTKVAQLVLDSYPIIPQNRLAQVEQLVFYIQKRLASLKGNQKSAATDALLLGDSPRLSTGSNNSSRDAAKIENLEKYLEGLYDESGKQISVAMIFDLSCQNNENMEQIAKNEVLMGALTRVFKEESRRNFDLATNILRLFYRLTTISDYHSMFAHWKIGALTLQLVQNELTRWDQWKNQLDSMPNERERKKWEFAMRKQDQMLAVALRVLRNLADDVRVEAKMLKKDLIGVLTKCLEHTSADHLLLAAVQFLWKLSIFAENQPNIRDTNNGLEKLVSLVLITASREHLLELDDALLALLFNLSFEPTNRKQMVQAGIVNFLADSFENNELALAILYQLSVLDDAKAMFAFTSAIPTLQRLLFKTNEGESGAGAGEAQNQNNQKTTEKGKTQTMSTRRLLVISLLINVSLEKRNAQLLCAHDGQGLNDLMSFALENNDVLVMKIARNVASHDGPTQSMFAKWIPQLIENILERLPLNSHVLSKQQTNSEVYRRYLFAIECLSICAQLTAVNWARLDSSYKIVDFLRRALNSTNDANIAGTERSRESGPSDDVLLQIIIWCGTLASNGIEIAKRLVSLIPEFMTALSSK